MICCGKIENEAKDVSSIFSPLTDSIFCTGENQMVSKTISKICSIEGCDKKYLARSLCKLHYERGRRRGGDVSATLTKWRNLVGVRYGKLIVVREKAKKNAQRMFLCRCDCGNTVLRQHSGLITQGIKANCGCRRSEKLRERNTTHGMRFLPEYNIWCGMKNRCNNPRVACYSNYGGRGIKVCERWQHSFEQFFNDMGERPDKTYTLDRINNNGDYAPNNCRWTTKLEQGRNTRKNRYLTAKGKTMIMAEWARRLGTSPSTIYSRLDKRGWTEERAVLTPVKRKEI